MKHSSDFTLPPERELIPYEASKKLPPDPWLVISPHPDDESIGMGGTIALATKQDLEVYILEITCQPRIREQEALEAGKILGISHNHFTFLHVEEGSILEEEARIVKSVSELVEEHKVKTIFVPSPREFHYDHRSSTLAISRWLLSSEERHHLNLITYEISRQWECNFIVCIDETFKTKLKAIRAYKSQNPEHYVRTSTALNTARCYTLKDCRFAEGFFAIKGKEAQKLIDWIFHEKCIEELRRENEMIKSSLWWKIATRFYRVRNRFLPEGSKRREIYNHLKALIHKTIGE